MPVITDLVNKVKGKDRYVSENEMVALICFAGSQNEDISRLHTLLAHSKDEDIIDEFRKMVEARNLGIGKELEKLRCIQPLTGAANLKDVELERGSGKEDELYRLLKPITNYPKICCVNVDLYNRYKMND